MWTCSQLQGMLVGFPLCVVCEVDVSCERFRFFVGR